jgi:hypothetical protein
MLQPPPVSEPCNLRHRLRKAFAVPILPTLSDDGVVYRLRHREKTRHPTFVEAFGPLESPAPENSLLFPGKRRAGATAFASSCQESS